MRNFIQVLVISFLFLPLLLLSPDHVLAAGSMYVSPASQTVTPSQNFSVAIRVNSGSDLINAVQANLSYDATKLDVMSINHTGSAFAIAAQELLGVGSIKIGKGTLTAVSGDKLIATAVFRPKASAQGQASVQFAAQTEAVSSTTNKNILTGTTGGTYTIGSTATATPVPTPTPSTSILPTPTRTALPTIVPSPGSGGSTIVMHAAGQPGKGVYPTMRLAIKGRKVQTYSNVTGNYKTRQFQQYTFVSPKKVTPDMVQVHFTNDYYNRRTGDDRNLIVNKIVIDSVEYQSEAPNVVSKGSWSADTGCKAGKKQSEWLHCKGYFQY